MNKITFNPKEPRIQITENGPYLVTGGIPLREMYITPKGNGYILKEGESLPQKEVYRLCRCGSTKTPPFCDNSHLADDFSGTETASKEPYLKRARQLHGRGVDMLDDGRCAMARFCHREQGTAWVLLKSSDNPEIALEVIAAASECPTGRLVAVDKEGDLIEPEFDPEIIILQDPEKGVSAGIYVRGNVELVGVDGEPYELQNRITLCRCGQANNKPFCDASHVSCGYRDDEPLENN